MDCGSQNSHQEGRSDASVSPHPQPHCPIVKVILEFDNYCLLWVCSC